MFEESDCPRLMDVHDLAEGELDAEREAEVRAHIARCAACAAEERELGRFSALLTEGDPCAGLPPTRQAALREQLLAACARSLAEDQPAAVAAVHRAPWWRGWSRRRTGFVLAPLALASLLLLLLSRIPVGGPSGPATGPVRTVREEPDARPKPSPKRGPVIASDDYQPEQPPAVPQPPRRPAHAVRRRPVANRRPLPPRRPSPQLVRLVAPPRRPAAPAPEPPATVARREHLIIDVEGPLQPEPPAAAPIASISITAAGRPDGDGLAYSITRTEREETAP